MEAPPPRPHKPEGLRSYRSDSSSSVPNSQPHSYQSPPPIHANHYQAPPQSPPQAQAQFPPPPPPKSTQYPQSYAPHPSSPTYYDPNYSTHHRGSNLSHSQGYSDPNYPSFQPYPGYSVSSISKPRPEPAQIDASPPLTYSKQQQPLRKSASNFPTDSSVPLSQQQQLQRSTTNAPVDATASSHPPLRKSSTNVPSSSSSSSSSSTNPRYREAPQSFTSQKSSLSGLESKKSEFAPPPPPSQRSRRWSVSSPEEAYCVYHVDLEAELGEDLITIPGVSCVCYDPSRPLELAELIKGPKVEFTITRLEDDLLKRSQKTNFNKQRQARLKRAEVKIGANLRCQLNYSVPTFSPIKNCFLFRIGTDYYVVTLPQGEEHYTEPLRKDLEAVLRSTSSFQRQTKSILSPVENSAESIAKHINLTGHSIRKGIQRNNSFSGLKHAERLEREAELKLLELQLVQQKQTRRQKQKIDKAMQEKKGKFSRGRSDKQSSEGLTSGSSSNSSTENSDSENHALLNDELIDDKLLKGSGTLESEEEMRQRLSEEKARRKELADKKKLDARLAREARRNETKEERDDRKKREAMQKKEQQQEKARLKKAEQAARLEEKAKQKQEKKKNHLAKLEDKAISMFTNKVESTTMGKAKSQKILQSSKGSFQQMDKDLRKAKWFLHALGHFTSEDAQNLEMEQKQVAGKGIIGLTPNDVDNIAKAAKNIFGSFGNVARDVSTDVTRRVIGQQAAKQYEQRLDVITNYAQAGFNTILGQAYNIFLNKIPVVRVGLMAIPLLERFIEVPPQDNELNPLFGAPWKMGWMLYCTMDMPNFEMAWVVLRNFTLAWYRFPEKQNWDEPDGYIELRKIHLVQATEKRELTFKVTKATGSMRPMFFSLECSELSPYVRDLNEELHDWIYSLQTLVSFNRESKKKPKSNNDPKKS